MQGGGGNDTLDGGADDDSLDGGDNDDLLIGDAGDDTLLGGMNDDVLIGGLNDDSLDGGDGNDTASFADATSGVTVALVAGAGTASGGSGTDTLVGIENLVGGMFADDFTGDVEANDLQGGGGNDTIDGDGGADVLLGGVGNDSMDGGGSDDTLIGGAGMDTLDGEGGNNIFGYVALADGATTLINGTPTSLGLTADSILDFDSGGDVLRFLQSEFGDLGVIVDGTNFSTINNEYDGTNGTSTEYLAGNASFVLDNLGNIYFDANGAGDGYTLIANIQGDELVASDVEIATAI